MKFFSIYLIILVISCNKLMLYAQNQDFVSEEEYKVYSIILKRIVEQQPDREGQRLVIKDSTIYFTLFYDSVSIGYILKEAKSPLSKIIKMDSIAWINLILKANHFSNKEKVILENKFVGLNQEIILIHKKNIFKNSKNGGNYWKKFHQKYPKSTGVINLSRVNFSENHSKSMVYIESASDLLAGSGVVLFLEKQDNLWKIIYEMNIWVS